MQSKIEIVEAGEQFELVVTVESENTGEVMRRPYATREEAEAAAATVLQELTNGPSRAVIN